MVFTVYKKLENLKKKIREKKSIIKDWSDKTKAKVNTHEDVVNK